MKIPVKSFDNKTLREIELPDEVFGYPYKEHLIHEAVQAYLAGRRRGTHKTKTRAEVSGSGRRKKEIIYTYSDEELVTTLRRLERAGRSFKEPQRYKGLGEMDAHQLAETTMEPQHRTLRRITLGDEAQIMEAESVFELLMGSSVEPRRDFIVEGARDVDRERIDA